jgi:LemA protein
MAPPVYTTALHPEEVAVSSCLDSLRRSDTTKDQSHFTGGGNLPMPNELDELTGPVSPQGLDVNVIQRQIPAKIGIGERIFEAALWTAGPLLVLAGVVLGYLPAGDGFLLACTGVLPGVVFIFVKIFAQAHLRQLQQKIQADASQIDNYLEQRVVILNNLVRLVERSIALDQDILKTVAAYRSGFHPKSDVERNASAGQLDSIFSRINFAVEAYPNIQAHAAIQDAISQNSYLQREITAARTLYNDTVTQWNQDIFDWPANLIVAAKAGYTTRIPFTASAETKAAARATVF